MNVSPGQDVRATGDSWVTARERLTASGYLQIAEGDWAWVHARPGAGQAVRVSPFDPAYRLFATVAAEHSQNPAAVGIETVTAHAGGGYSVTMERLDPVASAEATDWLAKLLRREPAAQDLLEFVRAIELAVAVSEIPLLVGLDLNPANVMRRSTTGSLVLTDALWIHGTKLYELVTEDPSAALRLYSRTDLEAYAHIPCMDERATRTILEALAERP